MTSVKIPEKALQVMVQRIDHDFRKATEVVEAEVQRPAAGQVLVKSRYLGVNAADTLFVSGTFNEEDQPPYPAGLETLGEVIAVGSNTELNVGDNVVIFGLGGAFSEYVTVSEDSCYPVPSLDPAYLSLVISGATASMALELKGQIKKGETVLVTGAAGGTGQFAIQMAKQVGCHVIGTCSTPEKAIFIKELGCDRAVVYKEESLEDVLKNEYPKGIDVVYECAGGDIFDTALRNLAHFGRLIVIGSISAYRKPGSLFQKETNSHPIPVTVLWKNADVRGFFLPYYAGDDLREEVTKLTKMYTDGQLNILTDNGLHSPTGPFKGLHMIADAVDYMFSRASTGKIVVEV